MKSKKITIWSTKGGVGKTSICAELHFRLGFPVVTNDEYSILSNIIGTKKLKILSKTEKIANYHTSMLFDFGGYIDNRIIDAIEQSTCIIVPISNSDIDIQGAIDTVINLLPYKKDINIIIGNRIKSNNDLIIIKEAFEKLEIKEFYCLNESKAFFNMFKRRMSIIKMIENNFYKYI